MARFVIGTYSDENSLTAGSETIYISTSQMIGRFRSKFPVELRKMAFSSVNEVYNKLTKLLDLDSRFAISDQNIEINSADAKYFRIWEAENQKLKLKVSQRKLDKK